MAGNHTLDEWVLAAREINKYNKGDIKVAYGSLETKCRIVVVRPFIEHLMHSVILCVSGRDTGATLFGPAGTHSI